MTSAADLRDVEDNELQDRLVETRQELFNLRFQKATGQLDNHNRINEVRRDIARMNTILREREIAAAEALAQTEEAR